MWKKTLAAIVVAAILVPGVSFADSQGRWSGHGYGRGHYPSKKVVVVRHNHHYDGAAIAAGVLGGIATGIILDRVLISFPPPQPVYSPPPPPRDPYDRGYSDGYDQGVERGRQERYEQGRRRGYDDGYEVGRSGRIF
jgi:hypothetical protein